MAVVTLGAIMALGQANYVVAETGLGGFKLFESGIRLLDIFGNPDDIQAIGIGTAIVGPAPAAGGGNPGGPPPGVGLPPSGVGGPPQGQGGGRGGRGGEGFTNDFGWSSSTDINIQRGGRAGGADGDGGQAAAQGTAGATGAAPAAPAAGSNNARQTYTRWIYKRPGVKYGFIIDRFDRIVQIDTIALKNPKIVTRGGITFGATFKDIIKKYGQPEVLELGTNQMVMRYLVKNKVAFRLNRLGIDKPMQVTAMMVAAGKY